MIAILNCSKLVTTTEAMLMSQACANQLLHHIAPAWGRVPPTIAFFVDEAKIPPDADVVVIFDEPDEPGVLGYHTEFNGTAFARVFVSPILAIGGSVLFNESQPTYLTVSSVLSHEIAELYVDPHVNMWSEGPAIAQGNMYAYEIVDPVESDLYVMIIPSQYGYSSVTVSNFVLPSWFDRQATSGPYDYLGRLSSPFSMLEDGYIVVREPAGQARQVYGARYPEWRRATKESKFSRTFRRSQSHDKI